MKKIVLILFVLLPSVLLAQGAVVDTVQHADSTDVDSLKVLLITDVMPNAIVHQDSALLSLMINKRMGWVRGEQIIDGFRVQIYASNAQQVAKNEALALQQRIEPLLEVPVYTQSEPPFWKVRIGNFKTREDANLYKEIFLQLFPEMVGSTYVVPDKVIIIQ